MTAALSRLGLARGAMVAVTHPDIHASLLILLACERLGLIAVPFRADEGDAVRPVLAGCDLVMSATPIAGDGCRCVLHMSAEWLAAASSATPDTSARPSLSGNDPVVLIRSSGSTGRPKPMLLTRAMLAARIAQRVGPLDYRRHDRFLATMQLTVSTVLIAALVCLRLGATVISCLGVPMGQVLKQFRPTQMVLLPIQLARLLDDEALPRLVDLKLAVIGGSLAPALRARALERLCGRLTQTYASNETAMICMFEDQDFGTPVPGISVAVAGDDGGGLSVGMVGEIRVRGPAVIDGYFGDVAASPADGWWRTGDFGILAPDGRLKLLGRRDDVLNFGGAKRAAADVEADVAALGIQEEIAVLTRQEPDGEMAVIVCIAAGEAVAARHAMMLRGSLAGRFAVYRIDAIPRTPEGKVRRADLRELIAACAPAEALEPGSG